MERDLLHLRIMVPRAGIEPARCCHRGIFLPTTAFAAALKSICGLDFLFIIFAAANLDGCRQVSTRSLPLTLPSPQRGEGVERWASLGIAITITC